MIRRTVLLYGQSLLLSGVAASLGGSPGLRVTQAAAWAEASRLLTERMPDVLIFDLSNSNESHVLPLLIKNPGLLLIGLDPERNLGVLLSGQGAGPFTMNRIKQIVRGKAAR